MTPRMALAGLATWGVLALDVLANAIWPTWPWSIPAWAVLAFWLGVWVATAGRERP